MSYFGPILTAVKDKLSALSDLTTATFDVRERPYASVDQGDTFPLVVLTRGEEKVVERFMTGRWVDYTVTVTVFDSYVAISSDNAQAYVDTAREAIRLALDVKTPLTSTSLGCVRFDPAPAFDPTGLQQLLAVSAQSFTFRNQE